ncbi:hypothetical protein VTN77DRAFT_3564 [Rasamsonia byssochlamydoides]|uniref:uncharacterized protein n=1 Tax=Rasamsonia byssochlamydoides TaxID=89139 RepID=UPI0037443C3B
MNRSLRLSPFPLRASILSTSSTSSLSIGGLGLPRWYATHSSLGSSSSSGPTRKQITVISDDGRLPWSELSVKEKVARATQQSFNFMLIAIGAVMTGGAFTFLYFDVFSPNSKTRQFNKAVERIKDDPRCTALLGDPKRIKAYGETTWSKWTRNRPIATSVEKDKSGSEHLRMHFHVEGPLNSGVVTLHMVRPKDDEYQYRVLALDVKGHPRIYLENASDSAMSKKKPFKIFGIQWR